MSQSTFAEVTPASARSCPATSPPSSRASKRPRSERGVAAWNSPAGSPRREHPLTARVMANRVWQYHFGPGIVRTPGNFGKLGEPPTHPDLLDFLARQFVASGWVDQDAPPRDPALGHLSAIVRPARRDAERRPREPPLRPHGPPPPRSRGPARFPALRRREPRPHAPRAPRPGSSPPPSHPLLHHHPLRPLLVRPPPSTLPIPLRSWIAAPTRPSPRSPSS